MTISQNLDLGNYVPTVEVGFEGRTLTEFDILQSNILQYDWETVDRKIRVPGHLKHRPDRLANQAYGEASLWWVIILANLDLNKTLFDGFGAGEEITIPKESEVNEVRDQFRQQD
jgi:hypothetical protein